MYQFIALYQDMRFDASDEPVMHSISIDTYCYEEDIPESTVWKWAIDKAFEYKNKFDYLSFSTLDLVSIS